MLRAISSLGGAVRDVMPSGPAWVWTSTETLSRSSATAAARGSAEAACASARAAPPPPTTAPAELSMALHIHSRRVSTWPQQIMSASSRGRAYTATGARGGSRPPDPYAVS